MEGMQTDSKNAPSGGSRSDPFHTTHWSLVAAAGRRSAPSSAQALATLCEAYWYPLYAYVRRRVPDVDEAQDITQAFFFRLLQKNNLAVACPERGKFRAFLLASMQNFLANYWKAARAKKRGGGRVALSLDFDRGESRLALEPAHRLTPERLFDRAWTLTLLDRVLAALRAEHANDDKNPQFEVLKPYLTAEQATADYAAAAESLGISEGAVRVAVHRLRKRYKALLRQEIAATMAPGEDIDDEIRGLFDSLRD